LLGDSGRIWLLEAHESEYAIFAFLKFDVLDLTELLEEVGEVISGPLVGEVFDVKIASLLGCLVSQSVSLLLHFSV